MTTSVESFIKNLGNPGNYQVLVFLLLACNFFPIAFNHWAMYFYTLEPEFNCKMPQGWAWHSNASIPVVLSNGVAKFDSCQMYKDPENHALGNKNCIYGWEYHLKPPQWPIIAEWNLVCHRQYLINVAKLTFWGGSFFGALLCGPLSEKYGRKNLMLVCLFGQTIIGISIFFIRQIFVFVALRTVQGILIQGMECISFVLVLELFQPRIRILAGSSCFVLYSFGMMFLALLAFSIQHWRYIQLAISIPSIITVMYIWLLPESLRFLMISQKIDQIVMVLKKYSTFALNPIPDSVITEVKSVCKYIKVEEKLTYDLRDLFCNPGLRRLTFFHSFCWFSAFLMYNSLTLFIPDLNTNKYINFFLMGLVELLAHATCGVVMWKFGRSRPLFILFIASGILSISSVLVDHLGKNRSESTPKVSTTLAILGKICITACISGLYIFSTETYPTVVRTIGVGFCAAARISGALLAPLVQHLGIHTLKAIPVILVGAVSLVAAFVVLMLPDTHRLPLPDTVTESEDLGKVKTISPMVDKASNSSNKTAAAISHPLTPPIKRAGTTGDTAKDTVQTAEVDKENEKGSKDINQNENCLESEEKITHNRNVRFLGIDIVDERPQKKISIGNDDRRVRFSNVVHDMEVQTSDAADTGVAAKISEECGESDKSTGKPAFSILKKTSQDENEKKIVKSPHPIRKLSPSENGSVEASGVTEEETDGEVERCEDKSEVTGDEDEIEMSEDVRKTNSKLL